MNHTHRRHLMQAFRFMLAPDTAVAGGPSEPLIAVTPEGNLDVPEIPKAGNQPEPEVVAIPETKIAGIQGPKEALGEDSAQEMEDMQRKMEGKEPLKRGPDGKFLPKDPTAPKKAPKPTAKAPDAPAIPKPAEPTPAPVSKVKIGDLEKTPDEWAQHFKDLESKAAKLSEPPKPEPAAPAPVDTSEDDRKAEEAFLAKASERYTLQEEELDAILSGGKGASTALASYLAKNELQIRKALVGEFNRVLAERDSRFSPVLTHHQQIEAYQRDQGFLEANPDIKTHPDGYKTYKEVEKEIRDGYAAIQNKVSNGTASRAEAAWATIYEEQPPEQFANDLAAHTRARLAAVPAPAAAAAPKPAQARKPESSVPATRPFNGDRPGGAATHPPTESEQARQLREMTEAGH